ncbi:response regulator [Psychroflexus sp. CAK8W]|uniref:histidine kinase n=1 Tax=Psychroflexus longus TaxID=2873596 RepID=A0ABS7XEQ1_9FLAO|nr:response regulator [Psychroflexus longus]MBZ9777413.1 response regulator [Psychroflexus longus]
MNLIVNVDSKLTHQQILEKIIPIYEDEIGCEAVCFINNDICIGDQFIIPDSLNQKHQNPEFFTKLHNGNFAKEKFAYDNFNDLHYYAYQLSELGWLILIDKYQLSDVLLENFNKPIIYLKSKLELACKTKSTNQLEKRLDTQSELVNEILSGVIIVKLDGSLFYLNKIAKKWTGIDDENLNDFKIFDIEENFKDHEEHKWLEHVEELKLVDDLKVEGEIRNVRNNKITFTDVSLKYFSINNKEFIIANLIDTTEKLSSKKKLGEEIELQDLLLKIAGKYLNINYSKIEETIQKSLGEIGTYIDADRVYIFDYNFKTETCSNTFEWCAKNISPEKDNLQDIPIKFFPEWIEKHRKKEPFIIDNIDELPDSGEQGLKAILSAQNIKSLITLPMLEGDNLLGFVGFDSVYDFKKYSTREIKLLSLFSHMLVNIQVRKQWENNFMTQRNRYRSIINNVNLGLIEVNKDFEIKFVNENFCNLLNYNAEELMNVNSLNTFLDSDAQLNLYEKLISLKEGENISLELRLFNKQKIQKPVFISICALIDKFNQTKGYLGSLIDLEEQKTIEQDLKTAKDKAEIASRAKETFLANISHEMRTPLHIINGTLSEVLKTDTNEHQSFLLKRGNLASNHLLNLVNNVLDIAKINSDEIQLIYKIESLYKTTEEVYNMLKPLADDKQIIFNFHFNLNLEVQFLFDAQKLNQVLINLISNAIKFTDNGSVDFYISQVNDCNKYSTIRFVIQDSGIGMTHDFKKDLFESFKREINFNVNAESGTGLGMPISKRLIKLMGSEIKVKTKKNYGSEFYFDLKLKKVFTETDPKNNKFDFENIAGKNILVTEDNLISQFLIEKKLKRQGANISKCNDGLEAIKLLKKQSFDLLLIDMQMPNLNGLETVKIIREELELEVPIVVITANVYSRDINKFKKYNIKDFVLKPFKDEDLYSSVSRVLEEKSSMLIPENDLKNTEETYLTETLLEIADDDIEFFNELKEIFQATIKETLIDMKLNMRQKNSEAILKILHKIKPSLIDLKQTDAVSRIRSIEQKDIKSYHEISENIEDIFKILTVLYSEIKDLEIPIP